MRADGADPFLEFWLLFPRHVARKSAEKAWMRVATSEALIEQIMAGLRAQLPAMLARDRQFIPYPATWLNQRRWEDELIIVNTPRVIACEKCGDTGVVFADGKITTYGANAVLMGLKRCECGMGLLPGVLAGVEESA